MLWALQRASQVGGEGGEGRDEAEEGRRGDIIGFQRFQANGGKFQQALRRGPHRSPPTSLRLLRKPLFSRFLEILNENSSQHVEKPRASLRIW